MHFGVLSQTLVLNFWSNLNCSTLDDNNLANDTYILLGKYYNIYCNT